MEEDRHACFYNVFRKLEKKDKEWDIKYQIILFKGTEYSKKNGQSNACLLTKRQLLAHINKLKGIVHFQVSISESKRRTSEKQADTAQAYPAMYSSSAGSQAKDCSKEQPCRPAFLLKLPVLSAQLLARGVPVCSGNQG